MARKFVSPAVFTNEVDQSFLAPGVGAIGAALIGRASKGPAQVPISVTNWNEYVDVFGDLEEGKYLGYAAKAYLKNSGKANIVRVLGPAGRSANGSTVTAGYTADRLMAINSITGSTGYLHAVVELTGTAHLLINDLGNDLFDVKITGSTGLPVGFAGTDGFIVATTASFLSQSDFYIKKVLNTDPKQYAVKGYYVRDVYDYAVKALAVGNGQFLSYSLSSFTAFTFGFNSASSPWINSQIFGGNTDYNLFRIHTLGHGEVENGRFKISISNVKVTPIPGIDDYGSFDLEVRNFRDSDGDSLVESITNLNLNPSSINYIAKRIGDKHWEYHQTKKKMVSYGNYANQSKLIRVEMTTGSFPATALPWGFRGLDKPLIASGSVSNICADLPLVKDLKDKKSQVDVKSYIYWGIETELSGDISARFSKYPSSTGKDTDFSLRWVSGSDGESSSATTGLTYNTAILSQSQKAPGDTTTHTSLEPKYAKFTVPLAFGFDGFDKRISDPLDNDTQLAAVTQIGVQALRQAVDIIADPDFIDINLLAIPGIYSSKVVEYAIDAIETRADAFYPFDLVNHSSSATTVTSTVTQMKGRSFNSNYAGTYYPGIKAVDPIANKVVELPSSIAAIAAIAYTDRVSYPWFAPAGLNRGGMVSDTVGFTVTETMDRLTADERDNLYENRINPIASFPAEGIAIWGQKTTQVAASALDRINVRRLLIKAKKLIASTTKYLVFEQNNASTWTRFKQMVNPILSDIQQKNGLEAFKVIIDETTNPPDLIDRNIMSAQIYLKPSRAAEFISIDFIITRSGAVFEE